MTDDRCLVRPRQKTAGATVYLVEELGDARMRCDQLVRYTSEAMRLIENSPHKDHFYEVAGHLLHAAPLTLFKLQKALQAVALAANRIDYEEIKTELRPEKVEQLEQVLEDVRIRQVQRHSEPPMTPQQVAAKLRQFAATTRKFQLPQNEVVQLITALEAGYEDTLDDERAVTATVLDGLADALDKPDAVPVDKLAADWIQKAIKDPGALHSALGIPEGETIPTAKIKSELAKLSKKDDLSAADKKLQKQLNLALTLRGPKVKKADGSEQPSRLQLAAMLRRMVGDVQVRGHIGALIEAAKKKQAVPPGIATQNKQAIPPGMASDEDDTKTAGFVWGRYEEGEDADKDNDGAPDNLSKEEAEKWKANTDKHKDRFKSKKADAAALRNVWAWANGFLKTYRSVRQDITAARKGAKDEGNRPLVQAIDKLMDGAIAVMEANTDLAKYGSGQLTFRTAEDWKVTAALKPKDKKVVDAFYEKHEAEGYLLSTDGTKLSKHGMGGGTFAEWKGGKIHILSPGGNKSHDDILRYMKKSIPKNNLADHPQLRSAASKAKLVRNPTKDQLMADLNTIADELFTARMAPRLLGDHLKDAEEDFITGDGPFAGMDERFVNGEVAGIRRKIGTLDNTCGEVARDLEYIAKKLKQTKTARYEEGEDADKDNDGAPDNLSKEEAEKWKANTDKHKDKFKKDKKADYDRVAVKLPSEEDDGKPGYDEDFKAGYLAGKKALKADKSEWGLSLADAKKAYKRVSRKHGSWWVDGYAAAIDLERGAYATKPAQIAKKMRLAADEKVAGKPGPKTVHKLPNGTKIELEKAKYGWIAKLLPKSGPGWLPISIAGKPETEEEALKEAKKFLRGLSKAARYEEGEDADKDNDGAPDNLSKEEAEKWKANTDKHKDKFKSKGAGRFVPIEKAKKGDMVQIEVGTPWPRPGASKKEKVTGKVVRVKKDGVVTVDVERSSSNPGGHSNEDVGYVDVKIASTREASILDGEWKRDPEWEAGFMDAANRNYEAIFGPNGEKDPGPNDWKA